MIEFFRAFVLGIVEGITEWLPVSSTGHMILVNEFIQNKDTFTSGDLFLYVIQLGAILAVATVFFHKLNPFSSKKTAAEKADTWQMWFKVVAACVPAAVIGLLFNDMMDQLENWAVVSAALIIYGIAFIVIERLNKKTTITNMNEMTYKTALIIGAFQVLSIIPGTSRSGSTILGGMIVGCSRELASEFSFFLAIPVMVGVSILKIASYGVPSFDEAKILLLGMVTAYLVSLASIKFLMNYVKNHSFSAFGVYRIILGIIVIGFFKITGL